MRNRDGISGLFFGSLPNLEELVAAKATIQANKDDEISSIQPMCCRELIFTEPKILVSPYLEEKNQLFLVTPKVTYESLQFQELLERLKIQSTELVDLTKSLFQFCLSFTMKQKLAPLWNKAGEFLVQGREFMLENSKLNAISKFYKTSCRDNCPKLFGRIQEEYSKLVFESTFLDYSLEVTITDKICIGLQACSLKSTPCKPEHFTASTRALDEFKSNSDALISDTAISDDLCFVLPSLKKGRISSITHQLPEVCPFASYEELRKHWKLMYGYRLPSEEDVFYNVHFYYLKEKIFTYPASCIRSSQVLVSPRCDHQLIFSSFLRDLSCRMPAVCGTPLTFTSFPLYPTSRLQQATHANHSNLTRTAPPQFSRCRSFAIQRSQNTSRQATISPAASQLMLPQESSQIQSPKVDKNAVNSTSATPIVTPLFSQSPTPFVPLFTSNRVFRSDNSERSASDNLIRPSVSGAQLIPMFSRKRMQSHVRQPVTNKNSGNTATLTRGDALQGTTSVSTQPRVHNTVYSQKPSSSVSNLSSSQILEREKVDSAFERNNARHGQILPEKRGSQTHESNTMGRGVTKETIESIGDIPLSTLCQGPKSPMTIFSESSFSRRDIPSERSPSSSTQVSKCLPQTRPGLIIIRQAPIRDIPLASSAGNVAHVQVGDTASLSIEQRDENHLLLNGTPTNRLPRSLACPMEHVRGANIPEPFSTLIQSRPDLARKRQINGFGDDDTPPKKPRSKPKIQEDVDVRELAIQDKLSKVNTVTLADWLKKRGVAVKTKDKKAELASKVMQCLALIQHEQ